jgi:hypothetical protein
MFNLNFKLKPCLWQRPQYQYMVQEQALKKHSSYLACFKKRMFNHVLMVDGRFVPAYNRRKHSHSHYLTLTHQRRQSSKVFGYMGQNQIKFCIGLSLKLAYATLKSGLDLGNVGRNQIIAHQMFRGWTALGHLMDVIETQSYVLLARNQCDFSLQHAKQKLNHQPLNVPTLGTVLAQGYNIGLNLTSPMTGFDLERYGWVNRGSVLRSRPHGLTSQIN